MEAVSHSAATLLQSYMEEGILTSMVTLWSRAASDKAIKNGPHASACALDMVHFVRGKFSDRVQDEFSILLSVEDVVQLFR